MTVSNALVCAIVDGIPVSDTERRRLLAASRLAEPTVRDITARTSIVRLAALWRHVIRATRDDFVGLAIGSNARSEQFGLGAHVALHGATFRHALLQFAKYATLVNDLLECRLEELPPIARFTARLHWNVLGLERHAVDITFAGAYKFARERLARPAVIHEVRLVHKLAASEARYRAVFGAPIVFGANRNELVFDADALDEPLVARSAEVETMLDRFAAQELARIPVVTDLPARVRQLVLARLSADAPIDLAAIAAQLAMTPRNLQRKLRDHATSLSLIVDDVRRSLAPAWLAEPEANVEQVAFRLGYSEPTAFIRAFKKWFGVTPGAYRRDRTG